MPDAQGKPMKKVMLPFECPADFAFTQFAIVAVSDDGQTYSTYMQPMHPVMALEFLKGLLTCVVPPIQKKLMAEEQRIVRPVGMPPGLAH